MEGLETLFSRFPKRRRRLLLRVQIVGFIFSILRLILDGFKDIRVFVVAVRRIKLFTSRGLSLASFGAADSFGRSWRLWELAISIALLASYQKLGISLPLLRFAEQRGAYCRKLVCSRRTERSVSSRAVQGLTIG